MPITEISAPWRCIATDEKGGRCKGIGLPQGDIWRPVCTKHRGGYTAFDPSKSSESARHQAAPSEISARDALKLALARHQAAQSELFQAKRRVDDLNAALAQAQQTVVECTRIDANAYAACTAAQMLYDQGGGK